MPRRPSQRHVAAFAARRVVVDRDQFAGLGIDETLVGRGPVRPRPPLGQRLVAPPLDQQADDQDQAPTGQPDCCRKTAQESQRKAAGGEETADDMEYRTHRRTLHSGIGSITAAGPYATISLIV